MRVAMIAPPWLSIPPKGYGGIENVIEALIPELLKLGIEIHLFTTGDSTIKATKKYSLYDIGQYDHIHKAQYDSLPVSIAHLLYAMNTIKADGKFDIIHDHNGFLGPLALAHDSHLPPVVHTLHGPPFTTPDRLALGIPDNRPMWQQLAIADNIYYVGISNALVEQAPSELRKHFLPTIHNAIDTKHFPFISKKSDYFLTLARFHPDKGQAIAVKACLELGQKLKMAGVVGNITTPKQMILELANPLSQYRGLLDFRYYSDAIFPHLLDGKIEYVGEVSGSRKLHFISRAKALLFPIQWEEPFGMAPIEALACGTPVIAMARGALPEIIDHGVNGFLAKNEKEFKQFMTRSEEIDPAACRESVERKFSPHHAAQKYVKHYQAVIKHHRTKKI